MPSWKMCTSAHRPEMKKLLVIFLVLFELGAAQAAQQRSGGGGRGNRDPRESPPTVGRDE